VYYFQISPHFQETVACVTRSRRRHLLLSGKSANDSVLSPKRRSVFRPLKFVGEATVPAKRIEHSSVTRVPVRRQSKSVGGNVEDRFKRVSEQDQSDSVNMNVEPHISSIQKGQELRESEETRVSFGPIATILQSNFELLRSESTVLSANQPVEFEAFGNAFPENCLTESQAHTVAQLEIDTPDMDWIASDHGKECPGNQHGDSRLTDFLLKSALDERQKASEVVKFGANNRSLKGVESKNPCRSVIDLLSSVLAMTPPPSVEADRISTVLAVDTPVSDYGLSYRQRALRRARFRTRTETPLS
jgi:hypothetical protein